MDYATAREYARVEERFGAACDADDAEGLRRVARRAVALASKLARIGIYGESHNMRRLAATAMERHYALRREQDS